MKRLVLAGALALTLTACEGGAQVFSTAWDVGTTLRNAQCAKAIEERMITWNNTGRRIVLECDGVPGPDFTPAQAVAYLCSVGANRSSDDCPKP